jgi:peroxisomal enoyl-CoA hydratase 2
VCVRFGSVAEGKGEAPVAVDSSVIGKPTMKCRVVVERGPVAEFARAVTDEGAVYHDRGAARAAGFADIPVPPTFAFSGLQFWGCFADEQPEAPPDNPLGEVMGGLLSKGGLILHGEQEFEYHRPLVVGDVLVGEGKVLDVYEKESKGRTMTFLVTEDVYRDEQTGEPVLTSRMNVIHRA